MSESENAGIARKIVKAVPDYDFDVVHDLVTDDIVVEQPFPALGQPQQYSGREAFVAAMKLVPSIFEQFKLTIKDLYDCPDDNVVIFEQSSRGVFSLNGDIYENDYVMLFKFDKGKVALWREYYNPEVMARGIGPILDKMSS